MEVANLLTAQRKGFLQQVEAVKYPVCEEDFGLDPEKLPRYWDDVSGKELKPEKVVAARKEEISVVGDMGVWDHPSPHWREGHFNSLGSCQQGRRGEREVQKPIGCS